MPAIGFAVLAGAVVLVALVWLIPVDQPEASAASASPRRAESRGSTVAASAEPTLSPATGAAPQQLAVPVAVVAATARERPPGAHEPDAEAGPTRAVRFAARFSRTSPVTIPSSTTTTTRGADGGAVSRTAYPLAIPIPVAMSTPGPSAAPSTASTPAPGLTEPTEVPEPVSPEREESPSPVGVPPVLRPATVSGPFANNSSDGASVTLSPRSSDESAQRMAEATWIGSPTTRFISRISEHLPEGEAARGGLLVAAGVAVGLLVATRR